MDSQNVSMRGAEARTEQRRSGSEAVTHCNDLAARRRARSIGLLTATNSAAFKYVAGQRVVVVRQPISLTNGLVSQDAVERSPGTPDIPFNDISNVEVADMLLDMNIIENRRGIWRGTPTVTPDDVYPIVVGDQVVCQHGDVDMDEAEYQSASGQGAFFVLMQVVWQMFLTNLIFIGFFVLDNAIGFLFHLYSMIKQHGFSNAWRIWSRGKRFGAPIAFVKGVSLYAFFMSCILAFNMIYSTLMFLVISLVKGDMWVFEGIKYGLDMLFAYMQYHVKTVTNYTQMRKWKRELPKDYEPMCEYDGGVLCFVLGADNIHYSVYVKVGPKGNWLAGYLEPNAWEVKDLGFDWVKEVHDGPLKYRIYKNKVVEILSFDYSKLQEWSVSNKCPMWREELPALPDLPDEVDMRGAVHESAEAPIMDLLKEFMDIPGVDREGVMMITDVVALVVVVLNTKSKLVLSTQVLALIVRYPKLCDVMVYEIKRSLARIMAVPDDEYVGNFIEYQAKDGNSFTTGFRDSPLGNEFMNLISMFTSGGIAASLGVIDLAFVKQLQSVANHLTAFESLEKIIRKLGKFLIVLIQVLKRCFETGSLAPLYEGSTMSPTRYFNLANQLMNEVRLRDTSTVASYNDVIEKLDPDLRTGQLSEIERCDLMEELYEIGERFDSYKRGEHDELIYMQINSIRSALRREIDAINTRLELNKFRVEPFSLGLAGPPGIGKSFVVRSVQRIVGAYLKILDSASIGFQWKSGQKFADGLTGAKRVYVFDDPDQKTGSPGFADTSPYVDWIHVRNSKPTMANMAEATDKGKYAYNALMAVWVTNQLPTYKEVRTHVKTPHAFARRFNMMWWMELAPGTTLEMAEAGDVGENSWHFVEYRRNAEASNDSDQLFVPTGRVITSRLEFLREVTTKFRAKMAVEKGKMETANDLDSPLCAVCGVSKSDHFDECIAEEQEAQGGGVDEVDLAIAVHESNDTKGVNPMAEATGAFASSVRDKSPEELLAHATQFIMWSICVFYVCHVFSMFYGSWYMALMIEFGIMGIALWFNGLSDEGKIRVALFMFPKQAIVWMLANKVMTMKVPAWDAVLLGVRTKVVMSRLKTVIPALGAVGLILCGYGLYRATAGEKPHEYQSVKFEGDDIVREQPKKEAWALMASTPRNVSTSSAKTYSEVGFKRAIESQVAEVCWKGARFPVAYCNSKTWVTNAHHWVEGGRPTFSSVCVKLVLPETVSFTIKAGSLTQLMTVDTKRCFKQIDGADVMLMRFDDLVSPGDGLLKFMPGDVDVNAEYNDCVMYDNTKTDSPVWKKVEGLAQYKKVKGCDKLMLTYRVTGGTNYGMCGSLVAGPSSGGGWLVLGMHSAGIQNVSGFAEPLTRAVILHETASLYEDGQSIRKNSDVISYQSGLLRRPHDMGPGSDLVVKATYDQTHVSSAVKNGACLMAVGTIEGFHARKFKSDVLETPFKATIEALALDRGVSVNFVNPTRLLTEKSDDPVKGKMIKSPFTQGLVMRVNKRGDEAALAWAVADYLEPILCLLRSVKPYKKMTYVEALDGTNDVTPVNLTTSTGPPYNTKKSNHLVKDVEGNWHVEPNFMADLSLIDEALSEGVCPAVVINMCVKAEVISEKKAAALRQRLLEVGPAALSIELKVLLGWLIPFIKSNKGLFEMSIGMNVYGLDAERLFERMHGRDPTSLVMDGDLEMQDGRTSAQYFDAACKIVLECCAAAGMPPGELERLRLLLVGFGDRMMCVFGDVFLINGGNPSGWYLTAIISSIVTILLLRCSFYKAHVRAFGVPPTVTYRSKLSTEVQGDDNITACRDKRVREWFDGKAIAEGCGDYGQVYTSSEKAGEKADWRPLDKASYLKRSFRVRDGAVVMPLELKSIAKQLMFYRKPEGGSDVSQWAVNVTNASRELSLHGPEEYENWMTPVAAAAKSHKCDESRFYSVHDWRTTFDGVVSGEFGEILAGEVDVSEAVHESSEATNLEISAAATTEVVMPSGGTSVAIVTGETQHGYAAHERAVRVRVASLATTDVAGTVITSFELVAALLGNTQLLDVYARYYAFRFKSITLRLQHNSSASMYGRYIVCIVPEANTDGVSPANVASWLNAAHATHHFTFNPANNQDIEFEIPWVCAVDSTTTAAAGTSLAPAYRVSLICLSPLTDAVNAAGASVSTVTMIANFNEVKFSIPVYQGKGPTIKASTVLNVAGMIGTAITTLIPGAMPFLPLAQGLAAAGKMAAEAGYTRHLAPAAPMLVTDKAMGGLGAVDGLETGMVGDWIQAAQITVDPTYSNAGSSVDEMTIQSLGERRHLVKIASITTSNAAGYVLASLPISPFLGREASSARCYHPLAFAMMMTGYWRGTLMYDMIFACSAMQSGSVFVYYSPTAVTVGSTVSTDFLSGAAGCIVELDPVKRTRVKVPWLSSRPMLRTYNNIDTATWPTKTVCNGFLTVVIMNPLAAPYGATTQLLIEMSMGSDMMFSGFRNFMKFDTASPSTTELILTVQGTLTQTGEETEECWISAEQPPHTMDGVVVSSTVKSVKLLCQRFSTYPGFGATVGGTIVAFATPASTAYSTTIPIPFYPTPPCTAASPWYSVAYPSLLTRGAGATTITSNTVVGFSMIGWLSTMYLGMKGGMSHKVIMQNTTVSPATTSLVRLIRAYEHEGYRVGPTDTKGVSYDTVYPPAIGHGVAMYPKYTGSQTMEFTLPYNSEKRFHPCCSVQGLSDQEAKWMMLNVMSIGDWSIQIMSAGAADFSLVGFRFAPLVPTTV